MFAKLLSSTTSVTSNGTHPQYDYFHRISKDVSHYAAGTIVNGTNVGGQFRPREELAAAAFELGKHKAKGTVPSHALTAKVNRLKGIVETVHGRHVARNTYQEHYTRGLNSLHAVVANSNHAQVSTPAIPVTPSSIASPAPSTPISTTPPTAGHTLTANTPSTTSTSPSSGGNSSATGNIGATHAIQTIAANRYENTSNGHNKFWTVAVHGKHVVKHWGAIGTAGQKQVKEYSSPQAASTQAKLMAHAKRGSGYYHKGASTITEHLPVLGASPAAQANSTTLGVPTHGNAPGSTHSTPAQLASPPHEVNIPTASPVAHTMLAPSTSNPTHAAPNSDPHGLASLDTPSKIKNALYAAVHKLAATEPNHPDYLSLRVKAKAIRDHANSKIGQEHTAAMVDLAHSDHSAGKFKLPFKARSKNGLPLAAQTSSAITADNASQSDHTTPNVTQSAPVATPAATPTQTEKERLTAELHKMWHQRGRNQADYAITSHQTDEMRALIKAAEAHEDKLKEHGVPSIEIDRQRRIHLDKGNAERKAEIQKEKEVKGNLEAMAISAGRLRTFGNGFGKAPVTQDTHNQVNSSVQEHFEKAAAVIGHDAATAIKQNALNKGMTEGTKDLQDKAKEALTEAAVKHGHALGYQGGFKGTPPTAEQHEANRKAMMDIHDKAKPILSESTLKDLTTKKVQEAKEEGVRKHQAEKTAYVTNLSSKISDLARTKGMSEAIGKAIPPDHQNTLHKNMQELNSLIGAAPVAMIHDSAYKAGKTAKHEELRDDLRKSAFVMGHHEGSGTTPTAEAKAAADKAHAMVKTHIGETEANKIKSESQAAGRAEALDPKITKEQVHREMKELGLDGFINSKFGEHWANNMPKISPKEFLKGFFGSDGEDKSNLQKINTFEFSSSGTHLSLGCSNGMKLYGSKLERLTREFNFSDSSYGDCPAHYVEHSFLRIQEQDRDKGSTKKMFQALMGKGVNGKCLYEKMGMTGCHVHGALQGGGYVWPSFGFYYDSNSKQATHQNEIKDRLKNEIYKIGGEGVLQNFDNAKAYIASKNIELPNADGTKGVRPLTKEDHALMLAEHKAIVDNLSNTGDLASGYKLTKMKTPFLNALHSLAIKANSNMDQKKPTFVKQLMMGTTQMYGKIPFANDNPQIQEVRKNLFK